MPCAGPHRRVVDDALRVVPHPVGVDHPAAGPLGDARASARRSNPGTPESISAGAASGPPGQFRRTRSWLPPMPPEVTITAERPRLNSPTTARDDGSPRPTVGRLQDLAGHPGDARRRRPDQLGDPVPEPELDPTGADVLGDPPDERRRRTPGPGAPGDVEAGHRVAVPADLVAAAFGPLDIGNSAMPCSLSQPASRRRRTPRRPSPIRRGQWSSGRSNPAEPSQSARASSAESLTPSCRCSGVLTRNSPPSDHQACPPRLAAPSWSQHDDRAAGVGGFGGGHQPGQPGPDDDDVCVRHGPTLPHTGRSRRCESPSLGGGACAFRRPASIA